MASAWIESCTGESLEDRPVGEYRDNAWARRQVLIEALRLSVATDRFRNSVRFRDALDQAISLESDHVLLDIESGSQLFQDSYTPFPGEKGPNYDQLTVRICEHAVQTLAEMSSPDQGARGRASKREGALSNTIAYRERFWKSTE